MKASGMILREPPDFSFKNPIALYRLLICSDRNFAELPKCITSQKAHKKLGAFQPFNEQSRKSGPQVLLAFWSVAVIFWSRVFFSARVALSLDGERAEPLANMLFGARQWTASSSVAAHQRCRVVKYCVAAELEDCAHD